MVAALILAIESTWRLASAVWIQGVPGRQRRKLLRSFLGYYLLTVASTVIAVWLFTLYIQVPFQPIFEQWFNYLLLSILGVGLVVSIVRFWPAWRVDLRGAQDEGWQNYNRKRLERRAKNRVNVRRRRHQSD